MASVLIVTASMGAGHTMVARELARRVDRAGDEPEVVDLLAIAGAPGARLRTTYRFLLEYAPWLYDSSMRVWAAWSSPFERLTARFAHTAELALATTVQRTAPDVVISTYNLASQALGRLKAGGRLGVPVATVVTDAGAHPYWISPHVELHVTPLHATTEALRRLGAAHVVTAAPVVRPDVAHRPARAVARHRLRLPERPMVLLSAGSWAAGRVRRTVRLLHDTGMLVVVLCASDRRLRAALAHEPGVRAVAWTSEMPAYLAAADVVVDNAGGLTSWEALTSGTPVVLFDPLPGHGRLNAATLAESGLVRLATTAQELRDAVRNPAAAPPPPVEWSGPPVEDLVMDLTRHRTHAER